MDLLDRRKVPICVLNTSKPVRPTGEFRGLVGIITAEIYEGALWFIMLQLTCVQLPIWLWIVYDEDTCKLESRVVGLMFISTQQIHYHSRRRIWVYSCRCSFEWRSSGLWSWGLVSRKSHTDDSEREQRISARADHQGPMVTMYPRAASPTVSRNWRRRFQFADLFQS